MHNQLPLTVDVGVSHVLFSRESVGSPEWLDPEWTRKLQSFFECVSMTRQIVLTGVLRPSCEDHVTICLT